MCFIEIIALHHSYKSNTHYTKSVEYDDNGRVRYLKKIIRWLLSWLWNIIKHLCENSQSNVIMMIMLNDDKLSQKLALEDKTHSKRFFILKPLQLWLQYMTLRLMGFYRPRYYYQIPSRMMIISLPLQYNNTDKQSIRSIMEHIIQGRSPAERTRALQHQPYIMWQLDSDLNDQRKWNMFLGCLEKLTQNVTQSKACKIEYPIREKPGGQKNSQNHLKTSQCYQRVTSSNGQQVSEDQHSVPRMRNTQHCGQHCEKDLEIEHKKESSIPKSEVMTIKRGRDTMDLAGDALIPAIPEQSVQEESTKKLSDQKLDPEDVHVISKVNQSDVYILKMADRILVPERKYPEIPVQPKPVAKVLPFPRRTSDVPRVPTTIPQSDPPSLPTSSHPDNVLNSAGDLGIEKQDYIWIDHRRFCLLELTQSGGRWDLDGIGLEFSAEPDSLPDGINSQDLAFALSQNPRDFSPLATNEIIATGTYHCLPHLVTFKKYVTLEITLDKYNLNPDQYEVILQYSPTEVDGDPQWINITPGADHPTLPVKATLHGNRLLVKMKRFCIIKAIIRFLYRHFITDPLPRHIHCYGKYMNVDGGKLQLMVVMFGGEEFQRVREMYRSFKFMSEMAVTIRTGKYPVMMRLSVIGDTWCPPNDQAMQCEIENSLAFGRPHHNVLLSRNQHRPIIDNQDELISFEININQRGGGPQICQCHISLFELLGFFQPFPARCDGQGPPYPPPDGTSSGHQSMTSSSGMDQSVTSNSNSGLQNHEESPPNNITGTKKTTDGQYDAKKVNQQPPKNHSSNESEEKESDDIINGSGQNVGTNPDKNNHSNKHDIETAVPYEGTTQGQIIIQNNENKAESNDIIQGCTNTSKNNQKKPPLSGQTLMSGPVCTEQTHQIEMQGGDQRSPPIMTPGGAGLPVLPPMELGSAVLSAMELGSTVLPPMELASAGLPPMELANEHATKSYGDSPRMSILTSDNKNKMVKDRVIYQTNPIKKEGINKWDTIIPEAEAMILSEVMRKQDVIPGGLMKDNEFTGSVITTRQHSKLGLLGGSKDVTEDIGLAGENNRLHINPNSHKDHFKEPMNKLQYTLNKHRRKDEKAVTTELLGALVSKLQTSGEDTIGMFRKLTRLFDITPNETQDIMDKNEPLRVLLGKYTSEPEILFDAMENIGQSGCAKMINHWCKLDTNKLGSLKLAKYNEPVEINHHAGARPKEQRRKTAAVEPRASYDSWFDDPLISDAKNSHKKKGKPEKPVVILRAAKQVKKMSTGSSTSGLISNLNLVSDPTTPQNPHIQYVNHNRFQEENNPHPLPRPDDSISKMKLMEQLVDAQQKIIGFHEGLLKQHNQAKSDNNESSPRSPNEPEASGIHQAGREAAYLNSSHPPISNLQAPTFSHPPIKCSESPSASRLESDYNLPYQAMPSFTMRLYGPNSEGSTSASSSNSGGSNSTSSDGSSSGGSRSQRVNEQNPGRIHLQNDGEVVISDRYPIQVSEN